MKRGRLLLAATTALAATVLVATALVGLSACGYSTQRLADFDASRTISVLPFENLGFRRDLELRLTQAVVTEMRARTSYALTTEDRADLVMSGRMIAGESVVIQDENQQPILKRLQGGLTVTIRNRRTGCVVKEYSVADVTEFSPGHRGESLEGSAYDEWVRRVAIRVVQGLEPGL